MQGIRRTMVERSLRALVEAGTIVRGGEGKRGKPYTYALAVSPSLPPSLCREGEREKPKTDVTPRNHEAVSPSQNSPADAEPGHPREGETEGSGPAAGDLW